MQNINNNIYNNIYNKQNLQKEIVNTGLILLNLTNLEEYFSDLKIITKPSLEKLYCKQYQEFNEKVLRPMLNCSITTQIEFLNEIKNIVKQMLVEEKMTSSFNFNQTPYHIPNPYMRVKSKCGDVRNKRFLSLYDFFDFVDKEYLFQVDIKLKYIQITYQLNTVKNK